MPDRGTGTGVASSNTKGENDKPLMKRERVTTAAAADLQRRREDGRSSGLRLFLSFFSLAHHLSSCVFSSCVSLHTFCLSFTLLISASCPPVERNPSCLALVGASLASVQSRPVTHGKREEKEEILRKMKSSDTGTHESGSEGHCFSFC